MHTLAILTNGGDTCALNASIRSIRDNAYKVGYKKIYGIRRGYQGLLDGWIDDITHREIDVRIGGSCLGSMRISPTKVKPGYNIYEIDEPNCKTMAQCLSDYRIDVLVVIGGDGTLQSTKMFQDWVQANKNKKDFRQFELIGFLKTIDNDIRTFTNFEGIEVALCPGFPSAVKKIVNNVEGLRVTARTAERAFAVEIMGRDAGWLAASATFGGAEILLVPEMLEKNYSNEEKERENSNELIKKLVDEIVYFYRKNRNVIIAVGEGFEPKVKLDSLNKFVSVLKDLYGPRKKVGATELIAMIVSPVLIEYFNCLSKCNGMQCENIAANVQEIIKNERKRTKSSTSATKKPYYEDDSHPLYKWDLNEILLNTKTDRIPPYKFEIRPHRTDYSPRSGQPSAYDYRLATVLGEKVAIMLTENDFGLVPALDKVVPYDQLTMDRVRTVLIDEIKTLLFNSDDYFLNKKGRSFQVSNRMIDFFKTITTGPDDLEEAIQEYTQTGFKK